jgi:F-type H+-transporting ATPase subunit b
MHLDAWTIALQTINFAVLVWLLQRFLYTPVLRAIDARKTDIAHQFAAAKAAEDAAAARLAAVETARAAIAHEREAAIQAAAAKAQALAGEREQLLAEARHMALDLGGDIAQRLLAEVPMALRAEAWLERIEQHFAGLTAAERDALRHQVAGGESLVVVTAAPLPPDVVDAWRVRLRRLLGSDATIAFEVDPALIAGAELRFPTTLLRFSWQNALASLRSEIMRDDDAQ